MVKLKFMPEFLKVTKVSKTFKGHSLDRQNESIVVTLHVRWDQVDQVI